MICKILQQCPNGLKCLQETGLKIIDRLDNGKFRALVNHICITMQLNTNSKIFSDEEEQKLLATLEIEKETLTILLDTIKLIYLEAAYGIIKPSAMEALMKNSFNISEEKVSIFTNAWITHGKSFIECLQQKSIFPLQVENINWEFNIRSSSSALSHDVNPVVWLQLGLSGHEANSKLTIEMEKNDLTNLYNRCEDIQRQLDLLDWVPEKSSS
ncbi:COMM domain-containing protein 10 isoform X2 [Venturia canescens]|uniref:COMM domain-containing protein 10 isoform X2 n=1 Tax=Venturia canescens TaxID=32260 RepID=UPI001C9BDC32|nr:COMM domain-containing protein 10-like isoform X2 [Venturia canescens]